MNRTRGSAPDASATAPHAREPRPDDIAVVGMALRVPGASSGEQFWTNIVRGVDCLTRTPREELAALGVPARFRDDPRYIPVKPMLYDIEYFDADFFGMAPPEAERTDPGHRLFIECAWEALERAGIRPGRDPSIGVFAGAGTSPGGSYFVQNHVPRGEDLNDPIFSIPARLGNFPDFLATRVSFAFDLVGPSFGVQAACATSLLAVHLAKESIRRGECSVALVGGASVEARQTRGYMAGVEGMLSSKGVVRTFDEEADGTVFGSGVGVVVLERLDQAMAAGRHVHAVIIGSGCSNDGAPPGKASFVAPSPEGQTSAIEQALRDAGVHPETIGYVEVHGTGTRLGDPTEVESLTQVYRRYTDRTDYCALGSVKPNVGHLRQAAGVAGLIKACLALEHGILPPATNLEKLNPAIDLENGPFFVPREARPWEENGGPRRAAVSAFGFGGSNAHVVLQSAPSLEARSASRSRQLLVVSAHTARALDRSLERLASHMAARPEEPLADVAHTLRVGRAGLEHRASIVAESGRFEPSVLLDPEKVIRSVAPSGHRPVVFMFPGQGSQRPGMGADLHEREPVYAAAVDECAELLAPHLGYDVRSVLYPDADKDEADAIEALRQTTNAQSALFVVEYAMARLFLSWGVEPSAMLGHSIGEYAAACVAGVFSLADALKLVSIRGRLMQACDPGAMLAVFLPEEDLRPWLADELEVAALNGPALSVVSGPEPAIADLARRLKGERVASKRLLTSHAFHSAMMDPALHDFRAAFEGVDLHPPRIPFVSNVTGRVCTAEQATDPGYWVEQLRRPVRFTDSVATVLATESSPIFVELGPGSTLCSFVGHQVDAADAVPTMTRKAGDGIADEHVAALEALGRAWGRGAAVDLGALDRGEGRRTVILPTYPFQRQRYWLEPSLDGASARDYSKNPAMYDVVWKQAVVDGEPAPVDGVDWIVIGDGGDLADRLTARLEARGATAVSGVDRGAGIDFMSLLRPFTEGDRSRPIAVLDVALVTGDQGMHNTVEAFDHAAEAGFHGPIALAQAAFRLQLADRIRLLMAADGLAAVDGDATELHAEKAVVFGPGRAIPQEVPGFRMKTVDLPVLAEAAPDWMVDALIDEVLLPDDATVVALRRSVRFTEGFRELPELPLGRMRLREGGTVLITGGTGGLGLEVAEDLFAKVRAKLVLTARWEVPPRATWPARAEADDRVGRALRRILALESRGAEVLLVTADAADAAAIANAVEAARAEFGGLHGVVHAAGVIDDGPVLTKSRASAEKVFGAKVRGAFALEKALGDSPLDFLVHFSSQAACTPGPGRVDYTAANSVLDSLARRATARRRGFHCSIGWGAWKDVGMAARMESDQGASSDEKTAEPEALGHPLVQYRCSVDGARHVYGGVLDPDELWILDEHRHRGRALMPGVGIIESVRAAFGDRTGQPFGIELTDVTFLRPLFVDEPGHQFEVEFEASGTSTPFEVRSRAAGGTRWLAHVRGNAATFDASGSIVGTVPPLEGMDAPNDGETRESVIEFGPHWGCSPRGIFDGDAVSMHVSLRDDFRAEVDTFGVHPALFDSTLTETSSRFVPKSVPFSLRSIRIHGRLPADCFAEGLRRVVAGVEAFDTRVMDGTGRILIEVEGLSKRPIAGPGGAGAPQDAGASRLFRLKVPQPGVLSSMVLEPSEPRPPGPGEVQIEVAAAGLNFRDVMSAMGQLPGYEDGVGELGSECSGRVVAVGAGVDWLRPGEAVTALARESLASHVTIDARLAVPIPGNVGLDEAAGIPIVFLTADYALNGLARLEKGERVLIHSATGGVGLAAVQLAQKVGAEVFGTAGSPEKRDYLREMGIEHVMDSRSLDFVDGVREATNGEGVDVVLNALAGDFIPASLSLLRPFGRFLEIGKKDVYGHMDLDLYPFHRNLAYFVIDLGLLMSERPDRLRTQFLDLMRRFEVGDLEPSPTVTFPMSDPAAGFGHLARANHIGKVVFTRGSDDPAQVGSDHYRRMFGGGISVSGGLAALRRVLSSDDAPAHVLVVPRRLDADRYMSVSANTTSSRHRPRPQLSTPLVEPSTPEEAALVEVWQDVLGIAPIGVDDDFFQLGGNSMTALQLTYTAGQRLGVSLPDTAVFVHPTITRFAAAVREVAGTNGSDDQVVAILEHAESLDAEEITRLLEEVEGGGTSSSNG